MVPNLLKDFIIFFICTFELRLNFENCLEHLECLALEGKKEMKKKKKKNCHLRVPLKTEFP